MDFNGTSQQLLSDKVGWCKHGRQIVGFGHQKKTEITLMLSINAQRLIMSPVSYMKKSPVTTALIWQCIIYFKKLISGTVLLLWRF